MLSNRQCLILDLKFTCMPNQLIIFENVSFSFKEKEIFNNLNLSINKGEFLWIKGNNGIGKTSLLRLILDFHSPNLGKIIRTPGLSVGWAPAVDNSFFPRLTGRENLQFFYELSSLPGNFELILKSEVVKDILKTPFYKMSSGMKQILVLSRSLILNPDLILWDEPFRSLDHEHQNISFDLLKELQQQKKTVILTSHLENAFTDFPIKTFTIKEKNLV